MRESRIFFRARVRRLAMVASVVRKASAISWLPKPQSVFNARAICDSGGISGWQQTNIMRSRSSAMTSGSSNAGLCSLAEFGYLLQKGGNLVLPFQCERFFRAADFIKWQAFLAACMIQAEGFFGMP